MDDLKAGLNTPTEQTFKRWTALKIVTFCLVWSAVFVSSRHDLDTAEVSVRHMLENGCAVLEVIDHGGGIPASDRIGMTERFARGDTARSRSACICTAARAGSRRWTRHSNRHWARTLSSAEGLAVYWVGAFSILRQRGSR
jgi:hypothetical protein